MELTLVKDSQQKHAVEAAVSVLLLDTAENLGVDFLQSLQGQGMKVTSERVNDKEGLFNALKKGNWDILLVCDQVNVPGPAETLACLKQFDCETGYVLLSKSELSIEQLTKAYRKGIAAVVSRHHPEYSWEVFVREAERSRRNYQLSQLNQEKFDLKRHCQQLMSGTEEALAYLQDGIHVYGNDAYLKLLGYPAMDELIVMPFIDIVSTEMREKTKQQLLDFQHKVRLDPEAGELKIPALFVNGSGEKEGVMEVAATFKPVVYDGDDCIQVVFKFAAGVEEKEGPGSAMEGLGYPLYITHLDNYITEAREAGRLMGHVVHVHGTGFEHYIAGKGFGSLNGKLKALASALREVLSREDLLIRFTENSFLILLKNGGEADPLENTQIMAIAGLLGKFKAALNNEIGSDGRCPLIDLSHEVIPVDAASESAESLIKTFLLGTSAVLPGEEMGNGENSRNNVIPFTDKADKGAGPDTGNTVDSVEEETTAPAAQSARDTADAEVAGSAETRTEPAGPGAGTTEKAGDVENGGNDGKAECATDPHTVAAEDAAPAAGDSPFSQDQLVNALAGNAFRLFYESVISVADIETEFYDIALHTEDGNEKICREALGATLGAGQLAAKLDLWTLHHALEVIADLYKQGQEIRLMLSFSARALAEKRLAETLRKELAGFGLPGEMVVIDFSIGDLLKDPGAACAQLDKIRQTGVQLSVSGVYHIRELKPVLQRGRISLVGLRNTFVEQASAEDTFTLLERSVAKLHEMKLRVFAVDINSNAALTLCCKAKIDLVKGEYIQKSPLELSTDSLAQEMVI